MGIGRGTEDETDAIEAEIERQLAPGQKSADLELGMSVLDLELRITVLELELELV